MKKLIFILISLLFINQSVNAQCCSAGIPVGGSTNIGILEKNNFRFTSYFSYSESAGYWSGSDKSKFNLVKRASYQYVGTILSYGLFNKLTVETEFGYYLDKSQIYDFQSDVNTKNQGISNGIISAKYNVLANLTNPFEWTVSSGVKFPFILDYARENNVVLPRDVQTSSHALGIIGQSFLYKGYPINGIQLFLINRMEINFKDYKDYKFGPALISAFFFSYNLEQSNYTGIAQIRHEFRGKDAFEDTKLDATGGHLVFLSPQLNYSTNKWNFSLLVDIPVYRYYNGTQLGNTASASFYVTKDFDLASNKAELPFLNNNTAKN
tara:strand:+ start:15363 stop:16331 length:969 start_codon:yes stop_codon:yes gene_type:complete